MSGRALSLPQGLRGDRQSLELGSEPQGHAQALLKASELAQGLRARPEPVQASEPGLTLSQGLTLLRPGLPSLTSLAGSCQVVRAWQDPARGLALALALSCPACLPLPLPCPCPAWPCLPGLAYPACPWSAWP
jgi:hypothetical protein